MKAQNEDNKQAKKQQQSNLQKFLNTIYYVLCGDDQLDRSINRSIVFNTYSQLVEMIYCIILYTWFQRTLNNTFSIIQVVISPIITLICLIPRLIMKYYGFLITMFTYITLSVASALVNLVLITNYQSFSNYCSILNAYSLRNQSFKFEASNMCSEIINLYHLQLGSAGFMLLFRSLYIFLIIKAYKKSKQMFQEQQKKRRRKEKYDENMRNKNIYNPNRKV